MPTATVNVIVKFKEDILSEDEVNKYDPAVYLSKMDKHERDSLVANDINLEPVFISAKTIDERVKSIAMVRKANSERQNKNRMPNFFTYFKVSSSKEKARSVAELLGSMQLVEKAYVSGVLADAGVSTPQTNPGWAKPETDFLREAPIGMDVKFAWHLELHWGIKGGDGRVNWGDGRTLRFVDIEHGWDLPHEDLNNPFIDGVNNRSIHGTACLGIVSALHNDKGTIGITPNVDWIGCVSVERYAGGHNLYDAIWYAIHHLLDHGDVLLLEVFYASYPGNGTNYEGVPVEIDDLIYHVMNYAAELLKIVIVEPAGNGSTDLDGLGIPRLTRGGAQDSGAIMVSAATSDRDHRPMMISGKRAHTHGTRIDCYAWGENIYTTYQPNYAYVGDTSGASAIIAGAALSIQGLAACNLGVKFTPHNLRRILSENGTPSFNGPGDKIGVMPDLKKSILRLVREYPHYP